MDVTNDDYIRLLSALLPPGPAWSASDPAIAGAAPSLTRVHQRADALMRELDPRTTTELINRWERLCGLPDECIPAGTQTLRQRQQRLDAKVNLAGGINEDFTLHSLLPWADQTLPSRDTTKARSPAHRPVLTR